MEIKLLQHYQFNLSNETLIENFSYSKLEQIRANSYSQLKLKTEYLLQRQLIRGALFKEYQRRNISNTSFLSQPSDIVIDYNSKGKPFLKDRAFHFSISHSRKLLIIVCSHEPIGVDIEFHQTRDVNRLASRFFHEDEFNLLLAMGKESSQSNTTQIKTFYQMWTFKEAWLKCRGSTLLNFLSQSTLKHLNLQGNVRPESTSSINNLSFEMSDTSIDSMGHINSAYSELLIDEESYHIHIVVNSTPIYEKFPKLQANRPKVSIIESFTPVRELLNEHLRISKSHTSPPKSLWLKDDSKTHPEFGGNKIRKFEFLMGCALQEVQLGKRAKFDHMVSIGFEGSNHCVATSLIAREFGLNCSVFLKRQMDASYVQENLNWHKKLKTNIWTDKDIPLEKPFPSLEDLYHLVEDDSKVFWVSPGGTHPVSHWGYTNAAFELKSQIDQRLVVEPDLLYIACGTTGSAVGLIAGLKLAGLKTKVIAVQVVPDFIVNQKSLMKQLQKFNEELELIGERPLVWSGNEFVIHRGALGEGYAIPTIRSESLVTELYLSEKLHLDWTYTAKVWDAIWQDSNKGKLSGLDIMYWNTYH